MYRITLDIDPSNPTEIIFAQFLVALRKVRELAEAEEECANYHEMFTRRNDEQNTLSQSV